MSLIIKLIKKIEKVKSDEVNDLYKWIRLLEEDFDGYIKKYPLIEKRVITGEGIFSLDGEDSLEIKQKIAMNIGQINHNRARKLLFKLMEQNIEKWWD